jgi:hypothetical protein
MLFIDRACCPRHIEADEGINKRESGPTSRNPRLAAYRMGKGQGQGQGQVDQQIPTMVWPLSASSPAPAPKLGLGSTFTTDIAPCPRTVDANLGLWIFGLTQDPSDNSLLERSITLNRSCSQKFRFVFCQKKETLHHEQNCSRG